jgi:glycerate-2-kinase
VVTLLISDTFENTLEDTASGPTYPDSSTSAMALGILDRHGLRWAVPESIIRHLVKENRGEVAETVRSGDPACQAVQHVILASNRDSLDAMAEVAAQQGFATKVVSSSLDRGVEQVADELSRGLGSSSAGDRVCLLWGGEPTVVVSGSGKGGRCQELAALMIERISQFQTSVFLAAGTDGSDFLPGVGGVLIDSNTAHQVRELGLDLGSYLSNNDTFHLHQRLGSLITCQPTHTNVCDLFVYLCDHEMQP